MSVQTKAQGLQVTGAVGTAESEILTSDALSFIEKLSQNFESRRRELLKARAVRLQQLRDGQPLHFLPETASIREADWKVAPIPPELQDRRLEITGPVDRKMIINALNSGANVFMADFEDSNTPTWKNLIDGQINLRDAVLRKLSFVSPEGKQYQLAAKTAELFVRPRGWHLVEKNVLIEGEPISASLFDFGLFFFHNAAALLQRNRRPCFYLPKLESHLEARLWNDVFKFSQTHLGIPQGSIRATVLIETIPAAFEMDEILFELKDHSAGLNCGRWDYIFSFIKKFSHRPDFVLPDRSLVTMDKHFLNSYVRLLIKTCHRRGIHAMGGMAAQIPIKQDPEANQRALDKVRQDKLREVLAGHDGTWIAHPGLVSTAKAIFDEHMSGPNQITRLNSDTHIEASDLLQVPAGPVTDAGVDLNIDVGLQYLESWLRGSGCVPIFNLMEDAATAEISRAQLWQWAHYGVRTVEGTSLNVDSVADRIQTVKQKLLARDGNACIDSSKLDLAAKLFTDMTRSPEFPEFLTLEAYKYIN